MGCLAAEMEAAALYTTAMRLNRRALAICTVSDLLFEPFDALDSDERERSLTQMIKIALETAAELKGLPDKKLRD